MPKASELLKEMTRYLDYRESSSGRTVFGVSYRERKNLERAFDAAPWCDMFIAQCSLAAGGKDMLGVVGDFALTTSHADWFRRQGRWHRGTDGIRPGDIVFFNWPGGDSIDHVATVEKVHSPDDIQTIDGNVGDMCGRRRRRSSLIAGYGRPAYDDSPSVPDLALVSALAELGDAPRFPGAVRSGQRGADVQRVQEKLRRRMFGLGPSGVDGDFGPATAVAVTAFQARNGLDATGVVDEETWRALWEAPLTP
ncbi:hypothetical protein GCM10009530_60870 [Microbispora corallina]|uniref:CHAP domain-containing protein n=1 Tax=Microbispora corallina TaxID=83302 RepID=A0ABQ4FZ51_9ACTN|nr:peptidoglycan-binding protein [Microbispora corallina]GIH40073.1 hypothetical protein Mco01_30730 [Microbispora corallina]